MSMSIERWVIVIGGLLQDEGTQNGTVRMWRSLLNFEDWRVEFRTWKSDWRALAELMWRYRPKDLSKLRVVIAGYSWGGYSATLLARRLERRGIAVDKMVLSDPVYRGLMFWRTLLPHSKIRIPAHVRECWSYVQKQDMPRGHALVPTGDNTIMHEPVTLQCGHKYADDSELFHQRVIREVRRLSSVSVSMRVK